MLNIFIAYTFLSCETNNKENVFSDPVSIKETINYSNEFEEIIKNNNLENIHIIQPFGKTEIRKQYNIDVNKVLFGKRAIAIDSNMLFMNTVIGFEIDEKNKALVIRSNDGGTYFYKNMTQEKMNRICLLYTSPSPRDRQKSRMPSSA